MIQRDPNQRKTPNEYLTEQRGKAFPEYFYAFLQCYMQIFSTEASMLPDQKISRFERGYVNPVRTIPKHNFYVFRIRENMDSILEMVSTGSYDSQGLGLLVTLITCNIR